MRARVEPQFVNTTPLPESIQSDYFIDYENVIIEPAFVEVAVSEDRLRFQSSQQLVIQTAPIDLANRTSSINEPVALRYDDKQGIYRVPQVGQQNVAVTLEISPLESSATFSTVPIYVEPITGIDLINSNPRTVDVTVRGPLSIIKKLTKEQLLVQPRERLSNISRTDVTKLEVGLQARYSLEDPSMAQNLSSSLSTSSALLEFIPAKPVEPVATPEPLNLLPPLQTLPLLDSFSTPSIILPQTLNNPPVLPNSSTVQQPTSDSTSAVE